MGLRYCIRGETGIQGSEEGGRASLVPTGRTRVGSAIISIAREVHAVHKKKKRAVGSGRSCSSGSGEGGAV